MQQRADIYVQFLNAQGAAVLWICAAFVPFFLVPPSEDDIAVANFVALVVVCLGVFVAYRDLSGLKRSGKLSLSDIVVMAVVPVVLFAGSTTYVLWSTYT